MNLLTIGGADPSSGAGIQSDIKTFSSFDSNCFTVITAITSQNTKNFSNVEPVSAKMVANQIDSVLSDSEINAIKISMVYDKDIIKVIHSKLKKFKGPIILDPVLRSTTGGILLPKTALVDFKKFLIPLCTVITPNVGEAEVLSTMKIKSKNDALKSSKKIKKFGAKHVIITGNEFKKNIITDFVLENSKHYTLQGKKIFCTNHGSGCVHSSLLTFAMASGKNLKASAMFAKKFSYNAIKNSEKLGKGIPISKIKIKDDIRNQLNQGINDFVKINKIHSLIPECQTNFVFGKKAPQKLGDILGISGRIVKSGTQILVAGRLEYGGSKHVASAILQISKKFPQIRSALNLKFEPRIIQIYRKKGLEISSYNRAKEPKKTKRGENSSILWGIKTAINFQEKPPDLIYHRGDIGKEPMILIFGRNPKEVVEKVSLVF